MAKSGLSTIFRNLDKRVDRMQSLAGAAAQRTQAVLEQDAKKNRPWRDRTNVARNSITGSSDIQGTKVVVALAIGAFYGEYLELSNAGRYAIVMPTINKNRHELANTYARLAKV